MTVKRLLIAAVDTDEPRIAAEARRWRDAGHEVVYLGAGVRPAAIAGTAIAEDVALVVLDSSAVDVVRQALAEADAEDIEVRALA